MPASLYYVYRKRYALVVFKFKCLFITVSYQYGCCGQGRSHEFAMGGQKRESGGDGSPPAGSRGRAPVEVWGVAPRSQRKMLISSYDAGTCTHAPLAMPLAADSEVRD